MVGGGPSPAQLFLGIDTYLASWWVNFLSLAYTFCENGKGNITQVGEKSITKFKIKSTATIMWRLNPAMEKKRPSHRDVQASLSIVARCHPAQYSVTPRCCPLPSSSICERRRCLVEEVLEDVVVSTSLVRMV